VITTSLLVALLAAAPEAGPIKLGLVSPLTGGVAVMGQSLRNGALLACETINAKGGVLGRPLQLVEIDDEASPAKGAQAAKDLVQRDGVAAIVGPFNTGVANAMAPVVNQLKVPDVVAAATGSKVNELFGEAKPNFVFRLAASDAIQSKMMVTEAFAARHRTKVALLTDDTPYGLGGKARLEALLEARGAKAVFAGTFKVGDTDMTALVSAAKAAGAEVLFLYGLSAEDAAVVRAAEKLGWKPEILGSWQLAGPAFLAAAGPAGNGAVMPLTFIEAGVSEPVQVAFVQAYRKRFAVASLGLAPAAAQGYDAVHLLAEAIAQAKSADPLKIQAALEDLQSTYVGVTGEYFAPWSSDDHEAVTPANVRWGKVQDGAVVPDVR
jgi:branched-chain amino acid transport system substrate-binding protein